MRFDIKPVDMYPPGCWPDLNDVGVAKESADELVPLFVAVLNAPMGKDFENIGFFWSGSGGFSIRVEVFKESGRDDLALISVKLEPEFDGTSERDNG